ncbi:AsmA-like C-terminal region-containing protein [Algoriphagus namhaensis]|uniref:AsmA-like C-terminal region-containing protein n=1 Tax=Algoriphagus namhaensis TaxID=915353 RepID=A0ABV8ASQ9_9BACT
MKKILLAFFGVFLLLILSGLALPFLFKDKIVALIDREIQKSVNAQVIYDLDKISLSFFREFPNISASAQDFKIVGYAPFEGDTLVSLNEIQVDFNLRSVLFDDYPTLTGIHLNGGSLYVKVLQDGQANYDIAISETQEVESTQDSNLKIAANLIEIQDLNLVYDDRSLDYFMALGGIQAKGSGEFTSSVFTLPIEMDATIANITYEGVNYLTDKLFRGETLMQVDIDQMKFELTEGDFQINDFLFDLGGSIAMPAEDIEFDLVFSGKDNSFKSLLSLVPGIYTESFSSLESSGTMDFNGFVKGIYSEEKFPSFDVSLAVKDGMFQYPDLPRPVKNVNLAFQAKNETAQLDNTSIRISTFNLDFGSNPISGNFFLQDLISYTMEGALNGKLNLEELTTIFPIEGLSLKGNLAVNAFAKGRYDSVAQIIPAIEAKLLLTDGYAKSADYPAPIEQMNVNASIQNPSGKMSDFLIDLSQFGFTLEEEKISGKLKIKDFDQLIWDGAISGAVDLKKLLTIFPMEDMNLEGRIQADLETKGSYAAVEAKKYNQLETRGTMAVDQFKYTSTDVPQGVEITEARATFNPERIELTEFDSKLGQSVVQANGTLSNYMNYLLTPDGILRGQLNVKSPRFNANEWMTESASTEPTESLSVIELPKNVDFTLSAAATEVLYEKLTLNEIGGTMTLRDGLLTFSNASMKTLGGTIGLNGSYDPRDLTNPKFDFDLNILDLSIAESFKAFNTVKAFAPVAQNLTGRFNTSLNVSGILGQDMMPVLSSLDAKGLLRVAETALRDSKVLEGITSLTRLKDANTLQLKNISIPITIENGVMDVRPFDVKLWDYQANIQGSAGFDGSMNYLINMQVPAGKFGAQANSLLATISGNAVNESTLIPIALNLSGTYNSPKIALAGGNSMETLLSNALKARVAGETQSLQNQATEQFNAVQDSLKQELKLKAEVIQDSVKNELQKQVNVGKEKAVDEAKKLLKGFLPKVKETTKPDTVKVNN